MDEGDLSMNFRESETTVCLRRRCLHADLRVLEQDLWNHILAWTTVDASQDAGCNESSEPLGTSDNGSRIACWLGVVVSSNPSFCRRHHGRPPCVACTACHRITSWERGRSGLAVSCPELGCCEVSSQLWQGQIMVRNAIYAEKLSLLSHGNSICSKPVV